MRTRSNTFYNESEDYWDSIINNDYVSDDGFEGDDDNETFSDRDLWSDESSESENDDNCVDKAIPKNRRCTTSRTALRNSIIWNKQSFEMNEDRTTFHGNDQFSSEILKLDSPYKFFSYFITNSLIDKIVEQTNLYSIQQDVNKPVNVNMLEIKKFIGILIYMSVYKYPNVRSYWSKKYGFKAIINTMPVNRFEKIRQFLHFNDNENHLPPDHPDHDRFHKIRPLLDYLNERFASIPLEQRLSFDEQVCATKIRHFMKQYLPKKPHKWGFELYVLCSLSGYAYAFEIYCGKEGDVNVTAIPNLGVTGNALIRTCGIVPHNKNHIIYFDNFYTSIPLVTYLAKQGILSLGTVKQNRLPDCKFSDKKQMMKSSTPRGTYEEYTAISDNVDITTVAWKDNKIVTLLSTYVGAEPVSTIDRFDKKLKKKIPVTCPKIIKEYNAHMGGVDLMDSSIGRYRVHMKSRKWYLRIVYHLLDLAVINSWVLYKKVSTQNGFNPKKLLNLGAFRTELAATLCTIDGSNRLKRGRPPSSSVQDKFQCKRKRGSTASVPPKDVIVDKIEHWPV